MIDLKVLSSVIEELHKQKGLSKEEIVSALEDSLASAYKREYGARGQIIKSKLNLENGEINFFRIKTVVVPENIITPEEFDDMNKEEYQEEKEKGKIKFIGERHILLDDAKLIKADAKEGDEIMFELEQKDDFSRIAAQAAKQTIRQKLREAEKKYIQEKFGDLEGGIITGSVVRAEGGTIFVDIGNSEAILPFAEQIKTEKYKTGDRISALLLQVGSISAGSPSIILSRTHPDFLRKLFEREVPEIKEGLVEIKKIVREPGYRAKIAVVSLDEDIDPVGTFVGPMGARVNTISSELSGERIDIIEWSEDLEEFVAYALSPADILDIEITEDENYKTARVEVTDDQFSLAVGRGGQNSRLAAKLTGVKIDINSVSGDQEEE